MILKISLRAKAGVPKTLVKRKFRLHSLYFPQNTLILTESRGEFSDLHSIFRLRALRYRSVVIILSCIVNQHKTKDVQGQEPSNINFSLFVCFFDIYRPS